MTFTRRRFLPVVGACCLAGQGVLLAVAADEPGAGGLRAPGLLLGLTLGLAIVLSLCRHAAGRSLTVRLWRAATLLGVSVLLALTLWSLLASGPSRPLDPDSPRVARQFGEAAMALGDLEHSLQDIVAAVAVVDADSADGGRFVRELAGWPRRWQENGRPASALPLALVAWRDRERVAWSGGARPLAPPAAAVDTAIVARDRDDLVYRRFFARGGMVLECQVLLGGAGWRHAWPALAVTTPDRARANARRVDFGAEGVGPGVALVADPTALADDEGHLAMRLLVGLLGVWILVAAGFVRVCHGGLLWLLPLWLGRGLLAAVEAHRLVAAAWPAAQHPARPGSPASLVDPAYFATPFLGGWFASAADALVTAGLLALTVWQIIQRAGPAAASGHRGRGPLAGLLFGLGTGGALLVLRSVAALLAVNANARLVGQGVALGDLSFWVLHAALMLISLSLTVLAVRTVAGRGGPATARGGVRLAGGLLAAASAGLLCLVVNGPVPGSPLLAMILVAALWSIAPGLGERSGLRRRLVWPAVMILVTVWNHTVLSQVYAAGERTWLESKAQILVESDPDWRRFLVGDVLLEMRNRDEGQRRVAGPVDLWRHEPAWALWRHSALRDLGIPCLVEIIDPVGGSEALHATGFMRDFRYEVVERSAWRAADDEFGAEDPELVFQTERRLYAGGVEDVLIGEIARRRGGGWLRAEIPVRSWRISTLLAQMAGTAVSEPGSYRPRAETDRPVLLLHGDDSGWLDAGDSGFPPPESEAAMGALRRGERAWAEVEVGGREWLCLWKALPESVRRSPGEGFVLGLSRPGRAEQLLDLSRLLLLNLALLMVAALAVQGMRACERRLGDDTAAGPWRAGFQERFLAGYLALGFVLLVLVGASVDRVSHERIRGEAAVRARAGLIQAVDQLRNLLIEQARSMAASEYIAELLEGRLHGARPVGPIDRQQGMVFAGDGALLLDETLGDLGPDEASELLEAARRAPLVVQRDGDDLYVGTVIPLDLGGVLDEGPEPEFRNHDGERTEGFFYYRQRLGSGLLNSLADLVQGEITLRFDGQPLLASHPGSVFAGRIPQLAEPNLLAPMLDHPAGLSVLAASDSPFALTGCQPLPAFREGENGGLARRTVPALLTVTFPDREREYAAQRRATALFLAGLASLILLTALLLAVVMSWNIFRPLRVLVAATRSLAAGDFGAPLPEAGRDEVGRLAEAFSRMRTELRSARDRLAAREQFLSTVLDRVTVGVAVVDAAGAVVALNPAGRGILAAFHPDLAADTAAARLRDELHDLAGADDRGAGQLRSPDGRRTLRGAVAPLDLPDGRTDTMLVFEDITDFLEAQKLAINAELARQVAHEIKNPLTPIQLSVQLLRQAWRDDHPELERIVGDTVDRVLTQVELLRSIAAEFSLLGRPGELATEALDLVALVNDTVGSYTAAAGTDDAGPRVLVDTAPVPAVLADTDSVRKILGNLMQNSLDARVDSRPVTVHVRWRVAAATVTMAWQDDGSGIPDEVADRLFDPYFSTKSAGTGLGLAICRNLADRMGGRITLTNRDDGPGAVAELTLRRAPDHPPQREDLAP